MAEDTAPESKDEIPQPVTEEKKDFCRWLFSMTAVFLMIAIIAAVIAGAPGDNLNTEQTYDDTSIQRSGIGGVDSLDNPWDVFNEKTY